MRRKAGTLVPLELAICRAAVEMRRQQRGEFHGYEIARFLGGEDDRRQLTGYGTLYRALGRLEDMGLLKSRGEDPRVAARENRPRRKLYTLTAAGVLAAERPMHEAPTHEAVRRWRRRPATA
jgi:PadR family transcriptional regulator PadR